LRRWKSSTDTSWGTRAPAEPLGLVRLRARRWARRLPRPAETGRDHRHPQLVPMFGSMTAPKIRLTSGCAVLLDDRRALVDLEQTEVRPAGDVEQDPRAPSMRMSSSLRRSLLGRRRVPVFAGTVPTAISAAPPSDMIVRTSAKSRLINPGTVIARDAWIPCGARHRMPEGLCRLAFLSASCTGVRVGMTNERMNAP